MGPVALTVPVRNTTGGTALLAGWLDRDADGTFGATERETVMVPTGATSVVLRWPAPNRAGRTFLRLRLYQRVPADPSPIGPAYGGEVTDDAVMVLATPRPSPSALPSPSVVAVAPVHAKPGPPRRPTATPTPTPSRPAPVPPAGVHATRRPPVPPWHPKRGFELTWSVTVLMVIPAAAVTSRGAAHVLHRRG